MKSYHSEKEQSLRSQIDPMAKQESGENEWRSRYEDLQQDHQELQRDLQEQQQVTNEVRQEASAFLDEMKAISERSSKNYEREEKLVQQVHRLEEEVKEWKSRYARTKTQLRTMRTNSMGLSIQQPDAGQYTKSGAFTQKDGLVKDIHVTKFQIAIDEVLRIARIGDPQTILDNMKLVVAAIRLICQDIPSTASPSDALAQHRAKLRTKVSATANNFITASKNYAQAGGLSPVSLLDAAASHLASSVIELVKTVKIRPTPASELEDDNEDAGNMPTGSPEYFSVSNAHSSLTESIYSPASTAQRVPSLPPGQNFTQLPGSQTRDYAARRSISSGSLPHSRVLDNVRLPSYSAAGRTNEIEDLKVSIHTPIPRRLHASQQEQEKTNKAPVLPRRPNRRPPDHHPSPRNQHPHPRRPPHHPRPALHHLGYHRPHHRPVATDHRQHHCFQSC